MVTDVKLARATEGVADLMDRILGYFKPGAKITVIVRRPDEPTQDFMLTSDSIPEIRSLLDRREADAHGR